MNIYKSNTEFRRLFTASILCLILALMFDFVYLRSDRFENRVEKFKSELNQKINEANQLSHQLSNLSYQIDNKNSDSFISFFPKTNIGLFLFKNDKLVYWNTNIFDLTRVDPVMDENWNFASISNKQCITKWKILGSDLNLLTIVPIRKNYPFQNQLIQNNFEPEYHLNSDFQIFIAKSTHSAPVYIGNDYLFSISSDKIQKNETFNAISSVCFLITYLLLLIVFLRLPHYFKEKYSTKHFLISAFIFLCILMLIIVLRFPDPFVLKENLFNDNITFRGNLNLLISLTIMAVYDWSLLFLWRKTKNNFSKNRNRFIYILILIYLIVAVVFTLHFIVNHISVEITAFSVYDLDFIRNWSHLLLFGWLIAITFVVFKILNIRFYTEKGLKPSIFILSGILLIIVLVSALVLNNQRKTEKINLLGKNILISGNSGQNFQPIKNVRSYSFPNLLNTSGLSVFEKSDLSLSLYKNEILIYNKGNFKWPNTSNLISKVKSEKIYYFESKNGIKIFIRDNHPKYLVDYLIYLGYSVIIFWLIILLLFWFSRIIKFKTFRITGVSTRYLWIFVSLFLLSFFGILVVSVNYFKTKYTEDQLDDINQKKTYIQKSLQELYYWTEDINLADKKGLEIDLQDLAYIYQTDIHVYDNDGNLWASSQPLIFERKLLGNKISPHPYFGKTPNINQYETIGKLNFLTAYSEFVNGDYLQLGYIVVPQYLSQEEIDNQINKFLSTIIHIYFLVFLLSLIVLFVVAGRLSEPLRQLEEKLKMMRLGNKNEKIEYRWKDEIGQLVEQYNHTIDELEKSAGLLAQSERESAWRTMARQIAHEINNPLTPMKLTIQQLQRMRNDAENFDFYFNKTTQTLIEQIDHLSNIAATFSNFARLPEAKFTKTDIAYKLNNIIILFRDNNEAVNIHYNGLESDVFVYADPEQIGQVFTNLLKNAVQSLSSDKKGKIEISLECDNKYVHISVKDNGFGIKEDDRDKLFTPNFTTKSTGMGLGLSIVKNILELCKGTIHFESTVGVGTNFTITIPIYNS